MALREDQIFRYSRQLLLPEVGGAGQERLLGHVFFLVGEGAAQETAAAYLAAAGCAVRAGARPVDTREVGFLLPAAAADRPLQHALEAELREVNADALHPSSGAVQGELGEPPARFTGGGPRVAVGALAGGAGVAFAAAGACGACFEGALAGLEGGLAGARSVVAGSVAALVAERLALGLARGVGLLALDAEGGLAPREVGRCERCR